MEELGCKLKIHPTALVSPNAVLEDGVVVGPYCVIEDNVCIGKNTVLRSNVCVKKYVKIGSNCLICENVVLGGEPQDFAFKGERSWVVIGNNVVLREFVTIHRATGLDKQTKVGNDCYFMEGVHIGHNVVVGNKVVMANKVGISGFVEIGDNVVFGGMSGVHQFVKIGRFCMIGGLSKIVKDIPPFLLVDGHPATAYGINKVGLRRAGFSTADRNIIKRIYNYIYKEKMPFKEAAKRLFEHPDFAGTKFAEEISEFILSSKRGIVPFVKRGGDGR